MSIYRKVFRIGHPTRRRHSLLVWPYDRCGEPTLGGSLSYRSISCVEMTKPKQNISPFIHFISQINDAKILSCRCAWIRPAARNLCLAIEIGSLMIYSAASPKLTHVLENWLSWIREGRWSHSRKIAREGAVGEVFVRNGSKGTGGK